MEAIILAAGRGTRMRGLCDTRPKPMLPVANEPLLDVTIGRMARADIERVFIVVGHCAEQIEEHYRRSPGPIPVEFIVQEKAEGTGQAALLGRGRMKEEPFMLAFGDIFVAGPTFSGIVKDFVDSNADMALTTRWVEDPWRGAAVYVDELGFVTRIIEKPRPGASTTHFDSAGTFCFNPRIWDLLEEVQRSPRGEYELTDAIGATLQAGGRIKAHEISGYWLNLTGPEELLEANRLLLEERHASAPGALGACSVHPDAEACASRLGPNVAVGPGCVVADNAEVDNAILMRGASVGRNARVSHAILAPGVHVRPGQTVSGSPEEAAVLLDNACA